MNNTPLCRCTWANSSPLMAAYHDQEWGVPERDSRKLWGKLVLDSFQAGLSWRIILRKREAFRAAFAQFEPVAVARLTPVDVDRLMQDTGIVRSRTKIEATIGNAQAYLAMQAAGEDFSTWLWGMVGGGGTHPRQWHGADTVTAVGRHLQSPQAARLQVCRRSDHLRLDAGRGHGGRPQRAVL